MKFRYTAPMRVLTSLSITVLICFGGTSCTSPDASPPPSSGDTYGEAASRMANEFWAKHITRCGDSYYFAHNIASEEFPRISLAEFKNYEFLTPIGAPGKKLSEADKLNDVTPVEWDGGMQINIHTIRYGNCNRCNPDGSLRGTEWRAWEPGKRWWLNVVKKEGQWHLSFSVPMVKTNELLAIKCSQLSE